MRKRNAGHELERAEDYLQAFILPTWRAWPEHYREASDSRGWALAKFLDDHQVEEVLEFITTAEDAACAFMLRIGFVLGRLEVTSEDGLTDADVCRAVEAAGGNPGRALADYVEAQLAGVAPGAAS
jgi:hypothetical protein